MKRRSFMRCCCGIIVGCALGESMASTDTADLGGGKTAYKRISACGHNCRECNMYKLPTDKSVQDRIIPEYRKQNQLKENEGIETIIEKGMYCKGCNVDKKVFKHAGCKIAACCKDTKKLSNCSECPKFPCPKITDFAKNGQRNQEAYEFLTSLRKTIKS